MSRWFETRLDVTSISKQNHGLCSSWECTVHARLKTSFKYFSWFERTLMLLYVCFCFCFFLNICTVSEMTTADSYGHGPVVKLWDQTSTTDVSDKLWVVVVHLPCWAKETTKKHIICTIQLNTPSCHLLISYLNEVNMENFILYQRQIYCIHIK